MKVGASLILPNPLIRCQVLLTSNPFPEPIPKHHDFATLSRISRTTQLDTCLVECRFVQLEVPVIHLFSNLSAGLGTQVPTPFLGKAHRAVAQRNLATADAGGMTLVDMSDPTCTRSLTQTWLRVSTMNDGLPLHHLWSIDIVFFL